MSGSPEGAGERKRMLLLFGASTVPPLVLLTVLAVIAAQNDGAALRSVERERSIQAAQRGVQTLEARLSEVEEAVHTALEPALFARPEAKGVLAQLREQHPYAARVFAVSGAGAVLWPKPELPFSLRESLGANGSPLESPGESAASLQARAELLARYDQARQLERSGELEQACAALDQVAHDAHGSVTLRARASLRLGACLERLERPSEAVAAYALAAAAEFLVRDDSALGVPVRVAAALRACELQLGLGGDARASAVELAQHLLRGRFRDDLTEAEWSEAVDRIASLFKALPAGPPLDLLREKHDVLARLSWFARVKDQIAPELLSQGPRAIGERIEHLRTADSLLSYRLVPASEPSACALIGFELDQELLVLEVLAPACGTLQRTLGEGLVTLLDDRGAVRAQAGDEAEPSPAALSGSAPLSTLAHWSLIVAAPPQRLASARTNRIALYAALIALTAFTVFAGARATLRFVERSLELAKLKSDFLSNITHELKTPLTSIKMYGEMLAMGRPRAADKRKEYAEQIVLQSDRLQKLIEDILDYARAESGAGETSYVLAEEDVADTVAEALDLFRASAKVRGFDLFVELPPVGELPPVDLDRDAVVRAVLNLLSNAVKYSGEGRYIRVRVARDGSDWIAISVEDRGLGIDPKDLEKIFDRFYRAGDVETRAVSGTGLGLSLVDQIVRAHNGQITVESEKAAGSVFTVQLPIVPDYRQQWPPPPEPPSEEDLPVAQPLPEPDAELDMGAPGDSPAS
ncbi:MAG: HAMP domain-containing histidine kinase [Planctomycetes bacterium]|nr:HAMP domain-containing histidine kinase [Planctomycetota bacterium]